MQQRTTDSILQASIRSTELVLFQSESPPPTCMWMHVPWLIMSTMQTCPVYINYACEAAPLSAWQGAVCDPCNYYNTFVPYHFMSWRFHAIKQHSNKTEREHHWAIQLSRDILSQRSDMKLESKYNIHVTSQHHHSACDLTTWCGWHWWMHITCCKAAFPLVWYAAFYMWSTENIAYDFGNFFCAFITHTCILVFTTYMHVHMSTILGLMRLHVKHAKQSPKHSNLQSAAVRVIEIVSYGWPRAMRAAQWGKWNSKGTKFCLGGKCLPHPHLLYQKSCGITLSY